MNKLIVGFSKDVALPKAEFLLIDDVVVSDGYAQVFDPLKDSFNPLQGLEYKRARQIADVLYTLYPQGENTLTVRNGKRELLKALMDAGRFDEVKGSEEVEGMISDILVSPVLKRVLCSGKKKQFSFNPRAVILARIDRAELGDFDALVLGLLLMAHYNGQIVVPDFGFYGRLSHLSLMREERLIAGVNYLGELPEKLRQGILLIKDKEGRGVLHEDAVVLARFMSKWTPGQDGYNSFVEKVMKH